MWIIFGLLNFEVIGSVRQRYRLKSNLSVGVPGHSNRWPRPPARPAGRSYRKGPVGGKQSCRCSLRAT